MKVVKYSIITILIFAVFTSSGFSRLTSFIDFTVSNAKKLYYTIEDLAIEEKRISEIQYEEYYETMPEFNVCYKSLNEDQKLIYRRIYAISQEMIEGFVKLCPDYKDVNRDIVIAYNAFLYDCVDVFWMPYTYVLADYQRDGTNYIAIAFSRDGKDNKVNYNVTKAQREMMKVTFDKKVAKIIAEADKFSTTYEKEKFFNDYICENTEYVTEGFLISTAYGAIMEGKAHCEGYSRAFKYLCNKINIECDLVCGTSFGEGHMWNVISVDGVHSYVDVTWNDRAEYGSYQYFNITERQLVFDHDIARVHTEATAKDIKNGSFNFVKRIATYSGNTYYEKMGYLIPLNFEKKVVNAVQKAADSGAEYIELLFTSENALSKFEKSNLKFISKIQKQLNNVKIETYIFERDVLTLFFAKK